tara:strand:+ start:1300 stop:2679 length:1380 start_codon:yes stop_codon:yes gene_type:complete
MFNNLTDKINQTFKKLKGEGVINEKNLDSALREIRVALLEADVALEVTKSFIERVKVKSLGKEVINSVSPGQMVIKIVNDELTEVLGSEDTEINLKTSPPAVILLAGLQGSGKTTTAAKLSKRICVNLKKKVLLASLDIYRPAAQEQLEILGEKNGLPTVEIIKKEKPLQIAKRALGIAKSENYDVLILDSAGRNHIDKEMMEEIVELTNSIQMIEKLLVIDSMAGQDAVNVAKSFQTKIELTGVILTRVDGDSRGGAALSMKSITRQPIKFLGTGESIDDIEEFHADRIANRILGMGDVVTLVEKAHEQINEKEAENLQKRILKGRFTLGDYSKQLSQISNMGGLGGLLKYLPGVGDLKSKLEDSLEGSDIIKTQNAIISSMTKKEKNYPDIIKASRKKRIANGSGSSVQEVNKLLKQFKKMSQMMKKVKNNKQFESMLKGSNPSEIQSMIQNNQFKQ